ncbi:conserved hypothetical protein [Peptoniphilus harei ACS-146-V-Sch2b]|uniref:Uncharacterized protein n=1 Tax=Peptoniphilus harei ACS-146-V-Sch2b TaxID=908338 RepID=E4KXU8_9FIRM|nr:hypothetical protein [Peptoniphilus harei]EFR33323.1 conserved hypothetical protein [Peptoniphilus harei ACS-146-V-Sch2b]
MKNLKKIAITLLVLFMLVPSFVFANSVEETPELKAKIENIVKTMPEDKAIDAIEELFGEKDLPNFSFRSAGQKNFKIYYKDKEKESKSNKAFTDESKIEVKNGFVYINLETQYMEYLGKRADVTKVIIIGQSGKEYTGKILSEKEAVQKNGKLVPEKIIIEVPESEIEDGFGDYNSMLKVKFETNLRDSFKILKDIFPDAMINPQARILFNS